MARQATEDDWPSFYIDPEHFQFKAEFPSFANQYENDPNAFIRKLIDQFSNETIKPAYQGRIEAIKKRKKLSTNAVTTDPEISSIIDEREAEINHLKQALFEAFLTRSVGAPPKIPRDKLVKAIRELGDDATQAAVAKELGVDIRTLRRWAERNGMQDWQEVKAFYLSGGAF
jgi:DNA-binding transcriptional regulator YiaG